MNSGAGRPVGSRGPWLALLALLGAGLAWWSWGRWTDPHIDFGNELYLAWQISEGRDLYAEMAHRNGPFSHYVNALWFTLFGVSLRTLVLCNLAILAAVCAMTFRIVRLSCGPRAAAVACAFQLVVFGFAQYGSIGNFNYVTPYQHFQTHGIALALGMILLLVEASRRAATWAWLAAGVCLGALFLGKVELFVPALAVAGLGLGRFVVLRRGAGQRALAAFAAGALLPVGVAWAGLATQMGAGVAARGVLGNWVHLGGALTRDAFYVHGAGLDSVGSNLALALVSAMGVVAFAAGVVFLDRQLPFVRARPGVCALAGAGAFGATSLTGWSWLPPGVGLLTAVVVVALWWPGLRRRLFPDHDDDWLALGLFAALALGLLVKLALRVRFGQYGFALAMPAALVVVVSLVSLLPATLRSTAGQDTGPRPGALAAALALGVVLACASWYWRVADRTFAQMGQRVGRGADAITFFAPERSLRPLLLERTRQRLAQRLEPQDTLLVVPEGVMFNYWLRRVNPTPYNLFLPTELEAFGEDAMIRDIARAPPDFILLVHRLSREFGVGPFGRDPRNGRALMSWIRRHYVPVLRVGAVPFTSGDFGTELLERRAHRARRVD